MGFLVKLTKHWFHQYLLEYYSKNKSLGLDIGCGQRNYHSNYKCNYIGIDLPTYYNVKLKPEICAEASFLPFQDNTFDLLVSYAVLPMVKNIDRALGEMHRVLRPKGCAIIIIMNLRGLALQPQTVFHNRYNSKKLINKLKEHKFKSIMWRNPKALLWSTWFDRTSVYAYAVATPIK